MPRLAASAGQPGLMMYGVPNMKTDKVDVVQRRSRLRPVALLSEECMYFCLKFVAVDGQALDLATLRASCASFA